MRSKIDHEDGIVEIDVEFYQALISFAVTHCHSDFLHGESVEAKYSMDDLGKEEAILSDLCKHKWVDARNEVIKSGFICVKCNVVKE